VSGAGVVHIERLHHTVIAVTIPIYEATQMQDLTGFPSGSHAGLATDDVGRSDERPPLVLLHGLTFDRRMWRPALTELEALDPGRRALALDLPGHGDSPDAPSYSMEAIVERVHAAVVEAHLEDPVIVGHSASAATASVYAARHRTRGVVAVEGTLGVGDFAGMAQSLEPVLRGPGFDAAWGRITANVFRTEEVAPDVREFVLATSQPRQEIVLGYWQDLFGRTPSELDAWIVRAAGVIRESGVPYVAVVGQDLSPEDVAWLRTNLPGARTMVWPHSGHFPHLAHPGRFAELLAETGAWGRPTVTAPVRR
jgi:pimeloyl-ACP methyl ester carboxylesterase